MIESSIVLAGCFFFLVVRLAVATANLASRLSLPRTAAPAEAPLVSILVPARNEEKTLPSLLADLRAQEYPNWEAWICDDDSNDSTREVLERFCAIDERIRWFRGDTLPEGVLGKPWACHQLAEKARGRYLLFLDADVRVSGNLISALVETIRSKSLALVSVFPQQTMRTLGEWLSVPLMTTILTTLLPMALILRSRRPAFSAANGQCMMFEAATYRDHRFHWLARSQKVDDIFIQREVKRLGRTTATLMGDERIRCRMYENFDQARRGFAKNVTAFFGESTIGLFSYAVLTTAPALVLAAAARWEALAVYVALEFALKIEVSALSRTSIVRGLLLSFPQHVGFLWIAISATIRRWRGLSLEWKGRSVE